MILGPGIHKNEKFCSTRAQFSHFTSHVGEVGIETLEDLGSGLSLERSTLLCYAMFFLYCVNVGFAKASELHAKIWCGSSVLFQVLPYVLQPKQGEEFVIGSSTRSSCFRANVQEHRHFYTFYVPVVNRE